MKKILAILAVMMLSVTAAFAQVPSVTLKTLDGKTINTAELSNDGKPFIIDFFATWCKPCNRELSAIAEVYEDWKEETGVKIIAVSTDKAQNADKVATLVEENGWPYETYLLDANEEFKKALGGQMIPFTVIVDGEGNIIDRHSGYIDGAEEKLIEIVRKLVK